MDFPPYIREFLDLLPDGMLLVDKNHRIIHVNRCLVKIFGYETSELIGLELHLLLPPEHRAAHGQHVEHYSRDPRKKEMRRRSAIEGQRKNGERFYAEVSLAPIKVENESYMAAVVRDLSQRDYIRRLEAKNREIEEFTYITSHDLQEPLRTILGLTNYLEVTEYTGLDEDTVQSLKFISEAARKMSWMVKALLDYTRIGQNQEREQIALGELIRSVLREMTQEVQEKHAQIHVRDLPIIEGVRSELRLLFKNLISNAIKFQRAGVDPLVIFGYQETESHHVISITDNGIGIAENNSEAIFRIFQRLHALDQYQGTGIGLAHCKKIAEHHQGSIRVESTLGKGSTFFIELMKYELNEKEAFTHYADR